MSRGPTCHHVRRRAQRDKGTSGGGGEAICTTCRAFAHPRIAILLGGESAASSFPPEIAATFGAKLAALARGAEGSLLVTSSRRTRADSLAALSAAIKDVPHIVWDDAGDNPYFAFLALADPSSRLRIR